MLTIRKIFALTSAVALGSILLLNWYFLVTGVWGYFTDQQNLIHYDKYFWISTLSYVFFPVAWISQKNYEREKNK